MTPILKQMGDDIPRSRSPFENRLPTSRVRSGSEILNPGTE
jgi:hypothetical protein